MSLDGLDVHHTTWESFARRYTCLPDYPISAATKLFANYAVGLGASKEALEQLGKLTEVPIAGLATAAEKWGARRGQPTKKRRY